MANALEAKEWARSSLKGMVEASYLTYTADGGLDEDSMRAMVRYFLNDLQVAGLHIDSTVCEFWAIPTDLRMAAREVVLSEMQQVRPDALRVVCCYGTSPSEVVRLVNHAAEHGADLAMVMTPYLEGCGMNGVRRYIEYITSATDVAIGIFNSEVAGLVLSPEFIADMGREFPAVCAVKNAIFQPDHSINITRLSGGSIQVSEYDVLALLAGIAQHGLVAPLQLGNAYYLIQQPDDLRWNRWWHHVTEGDLDVARTMFFADGMYDLYKSIGKLVMHCPHRPGVWHHHAAVMKYWAGLLGMPVGANPTMATPGSPQPDLDADTIQRIHAVVEAGGLSVRGSARG